MKKFFMGFAIGIVFVGAMMFILALIGIFSAGGRKPRVARNSALVLNLEGTLLPVVAYYQSGGVNLGTKTVLRPRSKAAEGRMHLPPDLTQTVKA